GVSAFANPWNPCLRDQRAPAGARGTPATPAGVRIVVPILPGGSLRSPPAKLLAPRRGEMRYRFMDHLLRSETRESFSPEARFRSRAATVSCARDRSQRALQNLAISRNKLPPFRPAPSRRRSEPVHFPHPSVVSTVGKQHLIVRFDPARVHQRQANAPLRSRARCTGTTDRLRRIGGIRRQSTNK